jgi:hypothetical protein
LNPDHPDKTTTTICAVVCSIVFMAVRLSVSIVVPALAAEFHYYAQVLSGLFCDEKAGQVVLHADPDFDRTVSV